MNHLLLDFGSTSVKYALYDDVNDSISEKGALPFPDRINPAEPFLCEIEPAKIREILFSLTDKFIESADAIHISVQMHGYLLADKVKNPLTGYISWRDKRSLLPYESTDCYTLFQSIYPDLPERDSGTKCKPNSPLCSVFTIAKQNPAQFHKTCEFFTLGSYLVYLLTGKNITHITDAAATGFYNIETTEKSTIFPYPFQIPAAEREYCPVGKYKSLFVYPAIGDHQASFLASGIAGYETYLLNLGTAAQLSTLSREPVYGMFERRPYFDGSALCTVSGLIGGREICESKCETEILVEQLTRNYKQAIQKLPPRRKILVTGGTVTHYDSLISTVCDRLKLPYRKETTRDALYGLVHLIKGD